MAGKCKICGEFYNGKGKTYCSRKCCHKSSIWKKRQALSQPKKLKEKNHNWRGGRFMDYEGYVWVRVYNHPLNQNGYYKEHRLIMEKNLGRYLKCGEVVHHKNHIRDDNRIDNLMLLPNISSHRKIHTNKLKSKL